MKYIEPVNKDISEIAYSLLMTGEIISYEDILNEYSKEDVSVSKHPQYNVLKKTIPALVKKLRDYGCNIVEFRENRKVYYQYKGANKLHNVHYRKELLEKYAEIDDCIKEKRPVRFDYHPFDKPSFEITFHPHVIKEFNGRLFSIGVSEIPNYEPMRKFVVAIDRINGKIRWSSALYITPVENEYLYLQDLVGVTYIAGTIKTDIVLRAYERYTYGRLITKPIHNSQKIVHEFQDDKGYGDVSINVYPNKELIGQILSYGSFLEVLSPDDFRKNIIKEVAILSNRYNDKQD